MYQACRTGIGSDTGYSQSASAWAHYFVLTVCILRSQLVYFTFNSVFVCEFSCQGVVKQYNRIFQAKVSGGYLDICSVSIFRYLPLCASIALLQVEAEANPRIQWLPFFEKLLDSRNTGTGYSSPHPPLALAPALFPQRLNACQFAHKYLPVKSMFIFHGSNRSILFFFLFFPRTKDMFNPAYELDGTHVHPSCV
jgi:hypothetical protein